jgi:hypothetical protein
LSAPKADTDARKNNAITFTTIVFGCMLPLFILSY